MAKMRLRIASAPRLSSAPCCSLLASSARKRLRSKKLFRFGFKALVMNRARSLIGRGDLARDLLAKRHAGHKPGLRSAALQGGIGCKCRAKARRYATRYTSEPSAGDQSIARGVGGIIAFDLANIFLAALVAHQ